MRVLKTIREEPMTRERSINVVQELKRLIASGASNGIIGHALFSAFAWEDTPQGRAPWSDIHNKLYHSMIIDSPEVRLILMVLLVELEDWLDA